MPVDIQRLIHKELSPKLFFAGGRRGTFIGAQGGAEGRRREQEGATLRTGELRELTVAALDISVISAGAIMQGADIARVLELGAVALQMLCAGMENRFIQSVQAVQSQAPPRVAIPN